MPKLTKIALTDFSPDEQIFYYKLNTFYPYFSPVDP